MAVLFASCDRHELSLGPAGAAATSTSSANVGNQPPAEPLVDPGKIEGRAATLSVRFADSDGLNDLNWGQILINEDLTGRDACYVHWEQASHTIHLQNDNANQLLGPRAPGKAGFLENSQCRVDTMNVRVTEAAGSVTLQIPITLKASVGGSQRVYVRASDRNLHTLEWVNVATWATDLPAAAAADSKAR